MLEGKLSSFMDGKENTDGETTGDETSATDGFRSVSTGTALSRRAAMDSGLAGSRTGCSGLGVSGRSGREVSGGRTSAEVVWEETVFVSVGGALSTASPATAARSVRGGMSKTAGAACGAGISEATAGAPPPSMLPPEVARSVS